MHVKIKEDTVRYLAPLPPLPPLQGRCAVFIRKRPEASQYSLLPLLQENRPVSPYFGRAAVLAAETPCFPSLLTDSNQRVRPLAPSNRLLCPAPPVKVDLKRGSFSSKQMMREAANTSVVVATRPEPAKRCSFRSPSPIVTTRISRVQQLSKQFKLDKGSLQQSLSDMSRRTQSTSAPKTFVQDPKKRLLTPPPQELPWQKFMAALDHVTRITDFSVL